MDNGAFKTALNDVDARLSSAITSLISSPSNPAECLPSLEQAMQSLACLSDRQLALATSEISRLLSSVAARALRAEALLETAAAFHLGCSTAHNDSDENYLHPNRDEYMSCSSLVRVEA